LKNRHTHVSLEIVPRPSIRACIRGFEADVSSPRRATVWWENGGGIVF